MKRGLLARLALAAASPVVLLGVAELALRAAGFAYAPAPMEVLIGTEDPIRVDVSPDPDLFWTMRRGSRFERNEARFEINALGTRGPLPARAKPPGVFRVVCLGDSTAFGNFTSYPRQLEGILADLRPDLQVEVINAGVPGFTSWQGLAMLERDLLAWSPDLVTWCFGFNDAKAQRDGKTDAERAGRAGGALVRAGRLAMRLRTAQALKRWIDSRRRHDAPFDPDRPDLPPRVGPLEHRAHLARAAERCAERGAAFLAITQPHALTFDEAALSDDDAVGADELAVLREQRRRLEAQAYAVRAECAARDLPLLDLAGWMRERASREWCMNPWPGHDSIHPNPLGARLFAERIADRLLVDGTLPPPPPDAGASGDAPPRPAWTVGGSAIVPRAADRDGDGLEEVVVAVATDGGARVAWWDPRALATRQVTTEGGDPLPAGDAIVSLAWLPRPGELLVTTRLSAGRMLVATRADGGPGRIAPQVVPTPADAAHLLVEPLDLDGDGLDELLVGYGPAGPNQLQLLSAAFRPLGTFAAAGGRGGPWLAAGRILSDDHDHALLTFEPGPPAVRLYGADRQFQTWIQPTLGMLRSATRVAPGRYHPDSSADGIVVARGGALALLREDGAATEPAFPFGALREERSLPQPGLAVEPVPGGPDRVWVAVRTGDVVKGFRVEGDRVSAAFELPVR